MRPLHKKEPFMNKPSARYTLAENLRIIRLVRHLSQEELAGLADLDRSYIGALERAQTNIGLDTLEKLAHALSVTLIDLLTEPDPHRVGDDLLEAVRAAVERKRGRVKEEAAVYIIQPPFTAAPRRCAFRRTH
jgi:transcriptional regulator with XRE-family HTH domain